MTAVLAQLPAEAGAWVNRYVGLPFERFGRGPDVFDCWGLVRWVRGHELGAWLPRYERVGHFDARDFGANRALGDFMRAEADAGWEIVARATRPPNGPARLDGRPARLLDVAWFQLLGAPLHVGLVVGREQVLHVRRGTESAVEPFWGPDGRYWAARLVAIARPRESSHA